MKIAENFKTCSLCLLLTLSLAFSARGFDWPAAGGTATIPEGTLVEVTSSTDLAAAAACGEIVVSSGATLSFTNITANATFAGKISGAGSVLATNAKTGNGAGVSTGCYRLTFTGDLSGFTGTWRFAYVYATFNTAKSGTFPMTYVEENTTTVNFSGAYTYANPLDFTGGPNTGLYVASQATLTGAITWRAGSIRGANGNPPAAGGTITGSINCPSTCGTIYIQNGIKMLGAEVKRASAGGVVAADGGPLNLKAKIVNFAGLNTYRTTGLITFLAEDLVPATCTIQFASSYASEGTIDLNGFNQTCKCLSRNGTLTTAGTWIDSSSGPATLSIVGAQGEMTFPGLLKGHISLAYASTSANTLSLTGGVHTTDGALRVTKGKLRLGPKAAFSKLSELEVSGTGALTLENGDVNPGALILKLAGTGTLTISAGVTQLVDQATVDGAYLNPGVYTKDSSETSGFLLGDGAISVLNGEKTAEGATFTWVGNGTDTKISTAANWKDGTKPSFDGTERLVFGGGAHTATVDSVVKAYAIDVVDSNKFVLTSTDDGKIQLGLGGLSFTNTVATCTNTHSLFVPVELAELPQHWWVAANAALETTKPWTGRAGGPALPLMIHSFGRVNFWGDNSGLETTLILTNCTATAAQPCVYNEKGLGSPNRETWITAGTWGCLPKFMTSRGPMTNNVPLRIRNQVTNNERGYFNDSGNNGLYFDAPITFVDGQSETYVRQNVHFRGGITQVAASLYTLRIPGAEVYLESPLTCAGNFAIDYGGTVYLKSAGNSWNEFQLYKATAKFYVTNALPTGKAVKLSETSVYVGDTTLDLNGFDQTVARLYSGLPDANKGDKTATVTSATPAVFTIAGSNASDDWGPFRFTGAVSLVYDKGGSIQMTNRLSTTTGTLDVRKGTVKFLAGAGWTGGGTNVVLNGGTIAVASNAGATAFGKAQDQSETWLTYESGTLNVAAGERATVRTVVYTLNGRMKSLSSGIYWATNTTESVSSSYKLAWLTGSGSLHVLKSAIPTGTFLIIR